MRRTAIVTGAAGALGTASAKALLEMGHHVVLTDQLDSVHEVAKKFGDFDVTALTADLSNDDAIRNLVATVIDARGGVDILVNNAGLHPKKAGHKYQLDEISLSQWQDVLFVNMSAPFLLYQAVLPHMKDQRWGRIVNISSRSGRTGSPFAGGHYSASKAGLIGLTRTMAMEAAPFGITANVVAPGPIASGMGGSAPNAEFLAAALASIPMGREGEPADVASAVAYFASDAANFVTGAIIDVTGGCFLP